MKNIKDKLLTLIGIGIGIVAFSFSASAVQVASTNVTTGVLTTNYFVAGPAAISSITLQSVAGAVTATFYDNSSAAAYYTGLAYTNVISYTTNLVNNYTTTTGITNYMTNLVLFTQNTVSPAFTNALPIIAQLSIPANSAQTFPVNIIAEKGLVMVVSTNVTATVNYRNPLQN